MMTIFSIPKSFRGNINIIQRNAIKSWLKLFPECKIILLGDDERVAETAEEFGILHIKGIEKNEFGTPLLNSAFNLAQKAAENSTLLYLNCDIILMSDFIPAVQRIKHHLFLMVGRRTGLEMKEEINFDDSQWENRLREKIKKEGELHGFSAIDYVVFPKKLPHKMLPFAVGRPGWDNWLIYHIRSLKIPVIDATKAVTVVHQNHDYSHSIYGGKNRVGGPEVQKSLKLAGGFSNMMTIRDADLILTREGLKKTPFPRRIFSQLLLFYPCRLILAVKRKLQSKFNK